MASEEQEQAPKRKGGGGAAKIAILALVFCNVLALGGLFAYLALGASDEGAAEAVAQGDGADGEKPAAGEGGQESDSATASEDGASDSSEEDQPEYSTSDLGPMVKLGDFVVNLNNPGQARYLKISLRAEVSDSRTRDELRARDPQMRDLVISYLSSLAIKETYGARAKAGIRDNLRRRLNQLLTSGEVRQIFFTDFMTQ